MQTVAVTNLPAPAAAARVPDTGQAARTDAKRQTGQSGSEDSPFEKCFVRGTGQTGGAKAAPETAGEDGTDAPEEDVCFCAATAGEFIAQLFAALPQNTGGEAEAVPTEPAVPETAPLPERGEAAETAALLPGTTAAARPETRPDTAAAAEMSAAPSQDIPAPQRSGSPGTQPAAQGEPSGEAGPGAAAAGVASRIEEAMRSLGKEKNGRQSFGEVLSDEKDRVSSKRTQENSAAWEPLPLSGEAGETENTEKSLAVEKALSRFAEDFRGAQTEKSELRIVLEPERLGALTISVSKTENGISAKIKSEDREICALISGHIQKLVQAMESRGVSVENVDVVFGGANQSLSSDQSGSGGSSGNPWGRAAQQGGRTEDAQAASFFDLWDVPAPDGETSSTVEYRV